MPYYYSNAAVAHVNEASVTPVDLDDYDADNEDADDEDEDDEDSFTDPVWDDNAWADNAWNGNAPAPDTPAASTSSEDVCDYDDEAVVAAYATFRKAMAAIEEMVNERSQVPQNMTAAVAAVRVTPDGVTAAWVMEATDLAERRARFCQLVRTVRQLFIDRAFIYAADDCYRKHRVTLRKKCSLVLDPKAFTPCHALLITDQANPFRRVLTTEASAGFYFDQAWFSEWDATAAAKQLAYWEDERVRAERFFRHAVESLRYDDKRLQAYIRAQRRAAFELGADMEHPAGIGKTVKLICSSSVI